MSGHNAPAEVSGEVSCGGGAAGRIVVRPVYADVGEGHQAPLPRHLFEFQIHHRLKNEFINCGRNSIFTGMRAPD